MIKKYYGWRIGGVLGPPGPPLGYAHGLKFTRSEGEWFKSGNPVGSDSGLGSWSERKSKCLQTPVPYLRDKITWLHLLHVMLYGQNYLRPSLQLVLELRYNLLLTPNDGHSNVGRYMSRLAVLFNFYSRRHSLLC